MLAEGFFQSPIHNNDCLITRALSSEPTEHLVTGPAEGGAGREFSDDPLALLGCSKSCPLDESFQRLRRSVHKEVVRHVTVDRFAVARVQVLG